METLLSAVLMRWQKDNGLPSESADEQLSKRWDTLTELQKEWLHTFGHLWDLTQMEVQNGK